MTTLRVSALLLAVSFALVGCIKSDTKVKIMADGTATLEVSNTYNAEAIDSLVDMVTGMVEAQGGEADMGEMEEGLDKMKEAFDGKKAETDMKEAGVEVESTTAVDKDGWKGYTLKGKVTDVNKFVAQMEKKAKAEAEKETDDNPLAAGLAGFSPKFYKTDDATIGEIVLMPSLEEALAGMEEQMGELEDMPDEQRDMINGMVEGMKAQFMGNDVSLTMEVELPGDVVSAVGAKKVGDKTVRFSLKGQDMNLDGMKTMFGMKAGVSAKFKIPEGCKITFVEKKAPEKKTEEAPEEKKSGGIKIGE